MNLSHNRCAAGLLAVVLAALPAVHAQSPGTAPAAATQPAATAPAAGKQFSQEQLDQMLASIALYPDALLSQILMASTYPLEIVEAARWTEANKSVTGAALESALQQQTWDESVKSLAAFPDVLARMNKDLAWTQNLGDAFLGQQAQVMETVQSLRQKAKTAGNLETNEQQKVVVENKYITIEPANPQVVYVPTYNPTVVYGGWWWPSYPPYYPAYWYPPVATPFVRGFAWGVGIAAGAALWGGFNWGGNDVNINVNKYNNFNKTNISNGNWNHNANHRNGVPYRDNGARQKYGANDRQASQARDQFRGREGDLGGGGLNNKAGLQDAANRGVGTGDRGGASNRAGDFGGSGARQDLGVSSRGQGERYGGGASSYQGNRGTDHGGGFGSGGSGAQARDYSNRGNASMGNRGVSSSGSMSRGGGGGGGARGGGGGGGRGGGGRR